MNPEHTDPARHDSTAHASTMQGRSAENTRQFLGADDVYGTVVVSLAGLPQPASGRPIMGIEIFKSRPDEARPEERNWLGYAPRWADGCGYDTGTIHESLAQVCADNEIPVALLFDRLAVELLRRLPLNVVCRELAERSDLPAADTTSCWYHAGREDALLPDAEMSGAHLADDLQALADWRAGVQSMATATAEEHQAVRRVVLRGAVPEGRDPHDQKRYVGADDAAGTVLIWLREVPQPGVEDPILGIEIHKLDMDGGSWLGFSPFWPAEWEGAGPDDYEPDDIQTDLAELCRKYEIPVDVVFDRMALALLRRMAPDEPAPALIVLASGRGVVSTTAGPGDDGERTR